MAKNKISPRVIYGIILFLIFCASLFIRVYLPYEKVFPDDWVRFAETDPWYHMRLVDNLLQHFPQHISFDPYTSYPWGVRAPWAPLFDLFLASVIWITGLGSPTQHTADVVAAYFPAILGALMTVPVYFIGKELFNRNAGLISAALIAILPGEFLARSLLGWTDHHILETLLTALTMLFMILALKRAREGELSFQHLASRDWAIIKRPLLYALLSGIMLGLYVLSWVGAPLLAFILFLYFVAQFIIDHLKGKATDYLCLIAAPIFLIAFIMGVVFLPQDISSKSISVISLAMGGGTLLVLSGISCFASSKNLKPAYYPLVLLALGAVGAVCFRLLDPSLFNSMLGRFSIFFPQAGGLTIAEVRPLLHPGGILPPSAVWDNFTTGLFIAFVSLGLLVYSLVKERNAEKTLLIVWSVLLLAATLLGQRRFAYYLAVNIALLSGYFCARLPEWIQRFPGWTIWTIAPLFVLMIWMPNRFPGSLMMTWRAALFIVWMIWIIAWLVEWTASRRVAAHPEENPKEMRKKGAQSEIRGRQQKRTSPAILGVRHALAIVLVFFLALYPNIGIVTADAQRGGGGPPGDWHDSLLWMRDNTPDPFQNPNFYYELYDAPPPGKRYVYPPSAYGVMSWWDYGHWITRIAHRIPTANPFQWGAYGAARFFTAQDEASATKILKGVGAEYVIIDYAMARPKFYAMAIWAGKAPAQFFEQYYVRTSEGKLLPVVLYYPAYYRSLCSRLYNFGGKAVVPGNTTLVISYEERKDERGRNYKELTTLKRFPTYEEGVTYLENVDFPNHRLVSDDPFVSPVPLEELQHFKLVHQSDTIAVRVGEETVSLVEVFEYTGPK